MTLAFMSVVFRSDDPQRDAEFWGAILGRSAERDGDELLLRGSSGQVGLAFARDVAHSGGQNRLHLHLADGPLDQRGTIAACEKLGARLRGNGHVPANSFAAMADVVGDDFCVIEDDNGYLAGTGPLGEVTCVGTRAVGHFWSRALQWPLVWEVGEETAVQAPAGGTKVAWGGEPLDPGIATDRQFFVLTVADDEFDEEVDRLIALGATGRGDRRAGRATLSDPDGVEFQLRTSSAS
jgi:hypothetical protein